MNQDLFMLLMSNDADKNPTKVINITPDVFGCKICDEWLGTEEDCVEHEKFHIVDYCRICNRKVYSIFGAAKDETIIPICGVCHKQLVELSKTFRYKWAVFADHVKRFFKTV